LDAKSRTQTEINFVYIAFIGVWVCYIFVISKINPLHRSVSPWVVVPFVVGSVYSVLVGFTMRKKFFRQSAEAISGDLRKALRKWKVAHFIGFACAMSLALYGVALKILGSDWVVAGIFLGLGLALLLFWRPRQLDVSGGQPVP
jgi:hypothetical protein